MTSPVTELITALATGISAFVATNLDDIILLMLFFSQLSHGFRIRHILVGQYLGFAVIILASLPGFFGGLFIPESWIGLLGFLPILIGVRQLIGNDNADQVQTVVHLESTTKRSWFASLFMPQTYHVAAVTVANGGDNIGIYIPLFANSSAIELIVILVVFLVMVGLWCWLAFYLARHPAVAPPLTRYGSILVPYILIGLGLFILIENGSYHLLLSWKALLGSGHAAIL